jgi:peroxiredoxin family protein
MDDTKKWVAKKTPAKKISTEKIKKALNNEWGASFDKEFNLSPSYVEKLDKIKVNNNKIRNKTMLKRIKNTIKNKIDSMFEKIGFHYVGYKVYITEMMKDIKAIKEDVNNIDNRVDNVDSIDYDSIKDDVVYEVEYKIDDVQSDLDDLRRRVERGEYDNLDERKIQAVNDDIKTLNKDLTHLSSYSNHLIEALDERVKLLEGLAFTGDDNTDDVKIDNIINDGLIMEFANYITDNIDVFDYDYRDVQRSVVMALLECKQYKIKVERVK